jgi:branched-chain amino acid transport system substrate-binding protein
MHRGWSIVPAALIGLTLAMASATAETVKIGILTSYSGFLAQAGDSMDKGIQLYVKLHEKDLPPGVTIELVRRDDTSNPDVGKRLAQELITREHVQILAGVVSSPVASTIAPLATEAKVPFVIMNAAGSAIPRLSPFIARVSFTIWQQAYPLGKWAAQQGSKTGYTAVSDYIPGHDGEGGFTKGFGDAGGTMAGSVRFPTTTLDFAPFVQRIKDVKPDVVFVFVPGGKQATAFMKAWSDLGLDAAGVKVVATQDLVTDDELPNMGDAPLGVVSAGIYSVAGKRPQNEAFLKAWAAAYGDKTIANYLSVGGWDGMAAIFDVIKAAKGKIDGEAAMAVLANWKTDDSPRGPIAIDPATRDIVQNVYIRRVEREGDRLANVEFATIPMVKDPWKELNPAK